MERKLVTIRRVKDIKPIEGADRIELVLIDGWQSISQKGNFKIGDLAVYHEIDSWLDTSKPAYGWLAPEAKVWEGKTGYKLRTKKLKKTLSQGLLLPVGDFPELKGHTTEGEDVTELVGVLKWEMPQPVQMNNHDRQVREARFPWFIPKTDEERIQNLPRVLEDHKDHLFEVTEKLDGTSATYFYGGPDKEFGVCSRNLQLKKYRDNWLYKLWMKFYTWLRPYKHPEPERLNSYWKLAKKYKLDTVMPGLVKQYAFQGEIIGPGIQKNPYKLADQEFYIFNIYDIEEHKYLTPAQRHTLLEELNKTLEVQLKHVPELRYLELSEIGDVQAIIDFADGISQINPKVAREGIVFKRCDGYASFKAISNKHLLKEE